MTENYSGDFVGWHQDMKYWGLVNLKPEERIDLVNMWLAKSMFALQIFLCHNICDDNKNCALQISHIM